MKRCLLLIISTCFSLILEAQISKTVDIKTENTLCSEISIKERNTITNLTISGSIGNLDFVTLRDSFPVLKVLDLSGASIYGDAIPQNAFYSNKGLVNKILTTIILPNSVKSIGFMAFAECLALESITIPSSLITIGDYAFYACEKLMQISIPATVTSIGQQVFVNCGNVDIDKMNQNYITIDGIVYNKTQDFIFHCSITLKGDIIIPSSVSYIETLAFNGCTNLTSVTIPASVTTICDMAFLYCSGLKIVNISNQNYASIDGVLFDKNQTKLIHCPISLKGNYTIPSSVTSIGNGAFWGCSKLDSISLSADIINLESYVFVDCKAIITVDANNPNYSSIDGVLFNKDQTILKRYPTKKAGSYIIPSSVSAISYYAFSSCDSLTSITIPSSVRTFGGYIFESDSNLMSIYSYAITPIIIDKSLNIFKGVKKDKCILYVPWGSKTAYQNSSEWNEFTNIVELPGISLSDSTINLSYIEGSSKLIDINSNIIWNASSSESWVMLNSDNSKIGKTSLTINVKANTGVARTAIITVSAKDMLSKTITVTQEAVGSPLTVSVKTILVPKEASSSATVSISSTNNWTAKSNQSWLTLSSSSGSSGNTLISFTTLANTGTDRTALVSISGIDSTITITIKQASGDGTRTIQITNTGELSTYITGSEAYVLTKLTITGTINEIDLQTIKNMPNLKELDITGATIINNTIPSYIFTGQTNLTSIKLPSTLSTIGYMAFYSCTNLKEIEIPSTVTTIEYAAFNNCTNLTTISIPKSVKSLANTAFQGCKGLTSITIPSSISTISDSTFYDCTGLISVIIPKSVKTIGSMAFANCSRLQSIISNPISPAVLATNNVFDGVNMKTCTLYVTFGSLNSYQTTSKWKDFNKIKEGNGVWLSTNTLNLLDSNSKSIEIIANGDWTATSNESWLTLSSLIGNGNDSILISAEPNLSGVSRTATITFTSEEDLVLKGSNSQTITVTQNAITETKVVNDNYINIFPNPATTCFNVKIDGEANIEIYNIKGQLVKTTKISTTREINVVDLVKGIYYVKIIGLKNVSTSLLNIE